METNSLYLEGTARTSGYHCLKKKNREIFPEVGSMSSSRVKLNMREVLDSIPSPKNNTNNNYSHLKMVTARHESTGPA